MAPETRDEPAEPDPLSAFSPNGLALGSPARGPRRRCYSSGNLIHKFGSCGRERPPPCTPPPSFRAPQRGHFGPAGVRVSSRHTGGSAGGGNFPGEERANSDGSRWWVREREQRRTSPSSPLAFSALLCLSSLLFFEFPSAHPLIGRWE